MTAQSTSTPLTVMGESDTLSQALTIIRDYMSDGSKRTAVGGGGGNIYIFLGSTHIHSNGEIATTTTTTSNQGKVFTPVATGVISNVDVPTDGGSDCVHSSTNITARSTLNTAAESRVAAIDLSIPVSSNDIFSPHFTKECADERNCKPSPSMLTGVDMVGKDEGEICENNNSDRDKDDCGGIGDDVFANISLLEIDTPPLSEHNANVKTLLEGGLVLTESEQRGLLTNVNMNLFRESYPHSHHFPSNDVGKIPLTNPGIISSDDEETILPMKRIRNTEDLNRTNYFIDSMSSDSEGVDVIIPTHAKRVMMKTKQKLSSAKSFSLKKKKQ